MTAPRLALRAPSLSRVRLLNVCRIRAVLIDVAGSAVYIFGIDQAISQPNIAFTLGNIQQMHHYTGTEQFVYKTLFFSAEGLDPDQTHTVDWVFSLNPDTGVDVQAALFDYAIVTTGKEDVSPGASVVVKYVYLFRQ